MPMQFSQSSHKKLVEFDNRVKKEARRVCLKRYREFCLPSISLDVRPQKIENIMP